MADLGIDLEELMDLLSRGHEAVFSLEGKEYIIQTEAEETEQNDMVMYQCSPTVEYLCRVPNGEHAVVAVLNSKCFNGCSFMDLLDHHAPGGNRNCPSSLRHLMAKQLDA